MRSIFLALLLAVYWLYPVFAQSNNTQIAAAVDLYKKGSYETALPIFEKCLVTAKQMNDTAAQVALYDHIGHVYSQTGRPAEALSYYQQSATIADKTGNSAAAARSLINIGALYEEQKDYVKALENYSKAEAIGLLTGDLSIIADCANNKGVIYEQYLKKYPEATIEYNKALDIYTKLKDQPHQGMAYNNLGIVYKYQGNYPKAIEYYKKSLAIGEATGNQFLIAANMTNIGNVYAMEKDYKRAIAYNTNGLEIALKIKAMNVVVEAASSIADDYAGMKDYQKAFEWHQRFSQYSDSLFNADRLRQVSEMEGKYEAVKKEKEITQLKDKELNSVLNFSKQKILLQKRNYQFAGIGGIIFLVGIISFLLYSRQQLKQKQQQAVEVLEAENKERKRISREMHDDIGAGLTQITLMSEHAWVHHQPSYVNDLAAIASTSRQLVSNMNEIVWSLNPENRTIDQLFAYLREQLNNLLEYSGIDYTIAFPDSVPPFNLTNEQKRNILMSTKEIVHNAIKYSKAKNISIMAFLDDRILKFEIADNGCGFDTSAIFSGNGMRHIRQRIGELSGKLDISSTEGKTAFCYSFPI